MSRRNYSTQVAEWLAEIGYTHCFFLAGGNIMHFLDAARQQFTCVPVVHEVSAGIAAEYFNEVSEGSKAFALVTAGPGLTNIMTAAAGAFTEGRELLILGGQVKSTDLARGEVRQRGIQEVDGVALMAPISKASIRLEEPLPRGEFEGFVHLTHEGRPGPVFMEFCLDAQGAPEIHETTSAHQKSASKPKLRVGAASVIEVRDMLNQSRRPVLLLGGGLSRESALQLHNRIVTSGIPVATTYNGSDRFDSSSEFYFGRPNTWGMRWSNVVTQQADLVIAVGTRLGLQQTGFNWQEFAPLAKLVQVDIDDSELTKGHPLVDVPLLGDAAQFLDDLLETLDESPVSPAARQCWQEWVSFGQEVRELLPLNDTQNSHHPGYWSPYAFVQGLSALAQPNDLVIPCSSGGAFTATYQALLPKLGQKIVSNKSLASMGYGLAGAIGAAIAFPHSRVLHVEGDGGFAQNLQELGTVAAQNLNIKMFIWINEGYASIRMTQRNYFDGAWIGCDTATGVGLPDWQHIFSAYGIPCHTLRSDEPIVTGSDERFIADGPQAFLIPIHPEQTFFPKISSRITDKGSMESNPLHFMSPELPSELQDRILKFMGDL